MLDEATLAAWEEYHSAFPGPAAEDVGIVRRRMARRAWEHIFPPPVLTPEAAVELERAARAILGMIRSIPARFFDEDCAKWTAYLGIPDPFDRLLCDCFEALPAELGTLFCRPDFLLTRSGWRLVEYNISTPMGGMNTAEPYQEAFEATEFARFLKKKGLRWRGFDLTRSWGGAVARLPRASLDHPHPLMFEAAANPAERAARHPALVSLTRRLGYSLLSGLITELRVAKDGVYIDHHRIDAVLCMFTWAELVNHVPAETMRSLLDAAARGLIKFISPPLHALFDSKANLELLTDDEFASFWSAEERRTIQEFVLPTKRLTPRSAAMAKANRTSLVLKPCSQVGGRGVLMGDQMSQRDWAAAVDACAGPSVTHVVQQKAPEPRLVRRSGPNGPSDYVLCLGPILFGDELAGIFARQKRFEGETPVINAKSGAEAGMAYVALA